MNTMAPHQAMQRMSKNKNSNCNKISTLREFQEKETRLRDALELREEFLSMANHELKTPIATLLLQIQMMKRYYLRTQSGFDGFRTFEKSYEIACRQIRRLTGLVDHLLDVSRLDLGKLDYEYGKLDLAEVVHDSLENVGELLDQAGVKAHLRMEENVIGTWDRLRIEQVLVNLLSNVAKHAAGSQIFIHLNQEEDTAVLMLQDTGPGIPAKDVNRIFDRYVRGEASRKVSGMGLGLYICRQIVEAHGGTIEVKSRPGEGTTFVLRLPLEQGNTPAQGQAPSHYPVRAFLA